MLLQYAYRAQLSKHNIEYGVCSIVCRNVCHLLYALEEGALFVADLLIIGQQRGGNHWYCISKDMNWNYRQKPADHRAPDLERRNVPLAFAPGACYSKRMTDKKAALLFCQARLSARWRDGRVT